MKIEVTRHEAPGICKQSKELAAFHEEMDISGSSLPSVNLASAVTGEVQRSNDFVTLNPPISRMLSLQPGIVLL